MELNCTYHFSKEKAAIVTVGEVFEAHCPVSAPLAVDVNKLKIKFSEPSAEPAAGVNSKSIGKYDLVVVKVAKSDENLGLALTSYMVGPKDIPEFIVTDGTNEFTIKSHLQFEVQSILKPDEKPEMFGPASGITIVIPMVYWILLGSVLMLLISSLGVAARRRWKRKKLLEKLATLEDGSQPIQQFFSTYRRLQRENSIFSARSTVDTMVAIESQQTSEELFKIITEVEWSFKTFIARRFQITQFELGWKFVIRELADDHDLVHSILGTDLTELSREFQKVGISKIKLAPKDVILISEKSRKWVEKADQLQSAILAKDSQTIKKLKGAK